MLIVFDLDDTLYDCFGYFPNGKVSDEIAELKPLPGVLPILQRKDITKVLLSKGEKEWQHKKIEKLGISAYFDKILVCATSEEKKLLLQHVIREFKDSNTWVVGDRVDSEIRFGNELGLKTVLLRRGKYADLKPRDQWEIPHYVITSFIELEQILRNMKAVILAAGKGTRLQPLTNNTPKVMIEINGKPFLWYVLENIRKAGCTEVGIVVGYHKEKIIDFLKKEKMKVTILEQHEQKGTADALQCAKEFCGSEDFIVQGGDNLFAAEDIQSVATHDKYCYVTAKEVENPHKYGVFVAKNDMLQKVVEKPAVFVGNLANVGLYKFTADIWKALEQIQKSVRGEYELTDALNILAEQKKVKVLQLQKYWLDLGTKEDIATIEGFLRSFR